MKPINILLVEDNPADARLTVELLRDYKVHLNIDTVVDGVEATLYLNKTGDYTNAPTPDLILLDLNMPRKDGRQLLEEIKQDPKLKFIPVVVLTTSQSEQDIVKSYQLQANCYITKPVDLEQFTHIVHSLSNFWFTVVKLPKDGI